MKTLTKLSTILMLLALFALSSCKKDKNNSADGDGTGIPEMKLVATANVTNPCAIAVSRDGKIAVTEYKNGYGLSGTTKIWNNYSELMANKAPAQTWQNVAAEAVTFDNSGNLFVVETEQTAAVKVYKSFQAGYELTKTYQGSFNNPRGIAFDSKNRLYLADDGNDRLLRFNNPLADGSFNVIAGTFGSLKGLAITKDTLFISSYNSNRLYKSSLTLAGGLNQTLIAGMNKTVDVATHGNLVAVASPESSTVTLFSSYDFKNEATYSGHTKQLKSAGAIYGLAFVETAEGKFGLLVCLHGQNKIALYQPE